MATNISPSKVLCDAAGIAPEGEPATQKGYCVLCGVAIQKGDCAAPFSPRDSFQNWAALSNPSGTQVCGHCQAVQASARMKAFQCLVASQDGVFRALANNEIAHVILNPPPAPFIVHIGMVGKSSHVTWRTPVSMSRDTFFIRDGETVVCVHRSKAIAAVKADQELMALFLDDEKALAAKEYEESVQAAAREASRAGKKPPKPKKMKVTKAKPMKSCLVLAPSFGTGNCGQLMAPIRAFVQRAQSEGNDVPYRLMQQILSLAPGDVWAMHRLVYADAPAPGARIETPAVPL